jgi:hypothetical protein
MTTKKAGNDNCNSNGNCNSNSNSNGNSNGNGNNNNNSNSNDNDNDNDNAMQCNAMQCNAILMFLGLPSTKRYDTDTDRASGIGAHLVRTSSAHYGVYRLGP